MCSAVQLRKVERVQIRCTDPAWPERHQSSINLHLVRSRHKLQITIPATTTALGTMGSEEDNLADTNHRKKSMFQKANIAKNKQTRRNLVLLEAWEDDRRRKFGKRMLIDEDLVSKLQSFVAASAIVAGGGIHFGSLPWATLERISARRPWHGTIAQSNTKRKRWKIRTLENMGCIDLVALGLWLRTSFGMMPFLVTRGDQIWINGCPRKKFSEYLN